MAEARSTFNKLIVKNLSYKFREAVSVVTVDMCHPNENEVCIRNKFVGINATDVNISAGRYFVEGDPPFDLGFEGVGEICGIGSKVDNLKVGQSVAYICALKAYAEYVCLPADEVFPIPEGKPEYIGLIACGLTATIGLDKAGRISEGETVLVTAAAGGTGHIAVQWAKAAGCHVIGTCSSKEKEELLKSLRCDRIINYVKEDISIVLAKHYPKGVNVIWETIGGKVFEACIQHLSTRGRILIVGGISGYKTETDTIIPKTDLTSSLDLIHKRSASIVGFLVTDYKECYPTYFEYLCKRFQNEEIRVVLDTGKESRDKEFYGMEGIIEGVEHLQSGKSIGKVVVRIS